MVDIDPVDRNYALLYSLVTATTAIAMYIGHAKKSAKRSENINLAAPYSVKNDLAAYVKLEGKHIIIVFAVLAVVCEVSVIVMNSSGSPNPIATALMFFFSLSYAIDIPILGIIIAYIVLVFSLLLVSVIARRREYNRRMIEKRKKAELSNKR